jgi:hypothetical protein
MSVPSGRLQFFALEAGDYLERLALIVGRPTPPDPDELVRLTRALRGASLMAGLSSFSHAAGALEQVAKAHRAGTWPWGPGQTELVAQAIEELKRLTRQAAEWSDADSKSATRLADELAGELDREGVESPVPARPATDELQPSVRVFVAKEGAMIAGTLEHAAQALELGQAAETAEVVLQRMQPLRGLATLPSLTPLPEFLDAIELTMRTVRDGASPPGAPRALRQVAAAVTRIAREIADHASADPDAPETTAAALALLRVFGSEDDVVEVRELFATGDPTPIVRRGSPPVRDAGDPIIELVSLADRLRQAADQLTTTAGLTARTLQLHGLVSQLRPLAREAVAGRSSISPLLGAITKAVTSGHAEAAQARFSDLLREAADRLARTAESRNAIFLADEVADIVAGLALDDVVVQPLGPPSEPVIEVELAALVVTEVVIVEPAVEDDSPIVPIESLAYDEPVPIESLAPDLPRPAAAGVGLRPFEMSFSTYHRLRHEPRLPAEPLEATAVVPIETLLYRGRRALERADVVRLELSDALAASLSFDQVQPLVSELIDLVPLALAE